MSSSISERASTGFDHFVTEATRSSFALPATQCSVTPISEAAISEHEVVMLTVSSYRFRVLLFIHFGRDLPTRTHLAALSCVTADQMVEERFIDAVMERGNLCCGALNRELAQFFPHIGMSTPCLLPGSSLEHIGALHPSLTRYYRAEMDSGVALRLTLAICAFADIDFPFDPKLMKEASRGELELF